MNRHFEPGTSIYWAVQTIDTGFAKSAWSEEQVYMIPVTDSPALLNIRNGTVDWNSAEILFDTDIDGNATVQYGADENNLNLTVSNSTLTLNHSISLLGLKDNMTFFYNVTSCNAYGCNTSGSFNFTTIICIPDWSCSSWGSCQSSNTQSCSQWSDGNSCGQEYHDSDMRSCTYSSPVSGTGPSYVPPATVTEDNTFSEIMPGTAATKKISDEVTITIDVIKRIVGVNIVVSETGTKPSGIPKPSDTKVYRYLEINGTGITDEDIEEAWIEFRVLKSWVEDNNIDRETVVLKRFQNGRWQPLETEMLEDGSPAITSSSVAGFFSFITGIITGMMTGMVTGFASDTDGEDYYFFRARTPGFSYFAITGKVMNEVSVCNNNSVCEPDDGEDVQNCPADCYSGPVRLCTPGEKRCHEIELQECNQIGTAWVAKEVCVYGCDSDTLTCNPQATSSGDILWYIAVVSVMAVAIVAVVYLTKKRHKKPKSLDEALERV